jgi:hypothetical protein
LSTAHILIRRETQYDIYLRETVLIPNTSTSLQITLAAEARLTDTIFAWDADIDKTKSVIYRAGSQDHQFPKEKDRGWNQGKFEK